MPATTRHPRCCASVFLIFVVCLTSTSGVTQQNEEACTGGGCTQLRMPVIDAITPASGSPCGGTRLKITGRNFNMPGQDNPWNQQRVYVGTVACIIDHHYTTATSIECNVEKKRDNCFIHGGTQHVTIDIMGLMGDYKKAILQDAFTFSPDDSFVIHGGGSWAATGGDVRCFYGTAKSHSTLNSISDVSSIYARIGDTRCHMDWCNQYEDEESCQSDKAACLARHVGDRVRQAGCEAKSQGFCRWDGDTCDSSIKKTGGQNFEFCCQIADSPMLWPGNFVLDVTLSSGNRGQNSCSGVADANSFCGKVNPASGTLFDISIFPRIDSVTPPIGSVYGGNLITVSGAMFRERCANTQVLIGGVPCQCVSSTYREIVCRAGDLSRYIGLNEEGATRGLRYEKFNTDGNVLYEVGAMASQFAVETYWWSDHYKMVYTGCFKPLFTANYTFYVAGDDLIHLYFGSSEETDSLSEIARVPEWVTSSLSGDKNPGAFFYRRAGDTLEDYVGNQRQVSRTMSLQAGRCYAFKLTFTEWGGHDWMRFGMRVAGLRNATLADGSPIDPAALRALTQERPATEWQLVNLRSDGIWRESWRINITNRTATDRMFQLRLFGPPPASIMVETEAMMFAASAQTVKSAITNAQYTVIENFVPAQKNFMDKAIGCTRVDVAQQDTGDSTRIFTITIDCRQDPPRTQWFDSMDIFPTQVDGVNVSLHRRASEPLTGTVRVRLPNHEWSNEVHVRRDCGDGTLWRLASDLNAAIPMSWGCRVNVWPSMGTARYGRMCNHFESWELLFAMECGDVGELEFNTSSMGGEGFRLTSWTLQDGDSDATFYERVGMEWFEMRAMSSASGVAGVRAMIDGIQAGTSGAYAPTYQHDIELAPRLLAVFRDGEGQTQTASPGIAATLHENDQLVACVANLRRVPTEEGMLRIDTKISEADYAGWVAFTGFHAFCYDPANSGQCSTWPKYLPADVDLETLQSFLHWQNIPCDLSALEEADFHLAGAPRSVAYLRDNTVKASLSSAAIESFEIPSELCQMSPNSTAYDDVSITLRDQSGDMGRCEDIENITDDDSLNACPSGTELVLRCTMVKGCSGTFPVTLLSQSQGLADPSSAPVVKFEPVINSIYPTSGSLAGGTPLTLSGTGLWCVPCSSITVGHQTLDEPSSVAWLVPGTLPSAGRRETLPVNAFTSQARTCLTPALPGLNESGELADREEFNVAIVLQGGQTSYTVLVGNFSYTADRTPVVDRFTPSTPSTAEPVLVGVEGRGFESGLGQPHVWMGTRKCDYATHTDGLVHCWLEKAADPSSNDCQLYPDRPDCKESLLNPGYSDPNVWVPGTGFAFINATFNAKFEIEGNTPRAGSTQGGTEICLDGGWWDPVKMLEGNGGYTDYVQLEVLVEGKPWLVDYTLPCRVNSGGTIGRLCVQCEAPSQSRRLQAQEEVEMEDCVGGPADNGDPRCFAKAMLQSGTVRGHHSARRHLEDAVSLARGPPRSSRRLQGQQRRETCVNAGENGHGENCDVANPADVHGGHKIAPESSSQRRLVVGGPSPSEVTVSDGSDSDSNASDWNSTDELVLELNVSIVNPGGSSSDGSSSGQGAELSGGCSRQAYARIALKMNSVRAACTNPEDCLFEFCENLAVPVLDVTPSSGSPAGSNPTVVRVQVAHGDNVVSKDTAQVFFGPHQCPVTDVVVDGDHSTLVVPVCDFPASANYVYVYITPLGYAKFASPYTGSNFVYTQRLEVYNVTPNNVSQCGGAELTVFGSSFAPVQLFDYETGQILDEYGVPEPEPEPEPQSDRSSAPAGTTVSSLMPQLVNEVVVCEGAEPEPEPEPESEPESEPEPEPESADGSSAKCLPCRVRNASREEVKCVAPPGVSGTMYHVRARVIDFATRFQGIWTRYFQPPSSSSFKFDRLEPQINFDSAWPAATSGLQDGLFEARMDGYFYAFLPGIYHFMQEANGLRELEIDHQTIISDAGNGDSITTTISGEVFLDDGPHFLSARYVGAKGDRMFFKLSYKGPDTPNSDWICVPSTVLVPKGNVGTNAGDWRLLRQAFQYKPATDGPVVQTAVWQNNEVLLSGTGFGSAGSVYVGSSLFPKDNFPCIVTSWTDTSAQCSLIPLPAGVWQARIFVPGHGWSCEAPVSFKLNATVSEVREWSGATATNPSAKLFGGYGGGVELTLSGTNLGLMADQIYVDVDDIKCRVVESGINRTKCVTEPFTPVEAVNAFPTAFPPVNLAGAPGARFFSDRGYSTIEAEQSHSMMIGNRKDEMLNLDYGGMRRMRSGGEDCVFGFELPAGKQALLSEAAVFPPVHPDRRKRVRTSVLQAKLRESAEWTDVLKLEDIEQQGATIAPGWSVSELEEPILAQEFRIVIKPDACHATDGVATYPAAYTTELIRSARFTGVVLDIGSSNGTVTVKTVRHPLALQGWNDGLATATLEYSVNRTPTLTCETTPRTGTARGGTTVTVCGENLAPVAMGTEVVGDAGADYAKIWFNGYPCAVTDTNDTAIECVTSPRVNGITPFETNVSIAGKGYALHLGLTEEKYFQYIDPWSDPLSWVNSDFPVDGDSVVVPNDQAILLDRNTPRLFLLLIMGIMEFDRKDLVLEATYIWVCGGHLRIGSEQEPFMHSALIQMYGERWKTIELPFIGSKMIAVTNRGGLGGGCHRGGTTHSIGSGRVPHNCQVQSVGKLDMHGRPDTSWTRLVRTVKPGAMSLRLAEPVNWPQGSQIIITPSHRGHQEEIRHVERIEDDGLTVWIDRPVSHEHLGTWYWHPNVTGPTDLRAAVGLQTKNIVIMANESALYGFNNDFLFGVAVHTMFGGEMRIENVEFTRTGQAANLGRYSSHWHNLAPGRNVDVIDKAYLRNNSYHDTFQRCTVIHGTDYAIVRDNVCHKSHGHGFFTEAGDEDFTLIEHNLAVNSQPHHLLLDDDQDAAGFWLPGFTGWHRHNMAANCIRGWRLRVVSGQGGDSQTDLTFHNNSAHACGFGWHLKPPHAPPTLNTFKSFTAFRCSMGMFYYGTGNIRHDDHRFVECRTGHLNNHLFNNIHTAPFYVDAVLVGNIDLDMDNVGAGHFDGTELPLSPRALSSAGSSSARSLASSGSCTSRVGLGFRWAKDNENMFASGIKVINFCNTPVMLGCFDTACTMRFEKFEPIHSYVYTNNWPSRSGIYWDLDGSLTGYTNGFVTWNEAYLHFPGLCHGSDIRHYNGVVCGASDGKLRLRKLQINQVEPHQLRGQLLKVKTVAGESNIVWDWKFYDWAVPVVSFLNSSETCGEEALEFDLWPQVWNTFQKMKFRYSESPYIYEENGFNDWEIGYNRTYTTPTNESIVLHMNFTHDWRNHFSVDSRRRRGPPIRETRLRRKPLSCQDPFGAHAMKLWQHECNLYNWSAFGLNGTGNLSMVSGSTCARHAAATCGGPNELCYFDESCTTSQAASTCNAGGAGQNCRFCGEPYSHHGDCPASDFAYNESDGTRDRGACNGGYTNETGLALKEKLNEEPLIPQVGGRWTALMSMKIAGDKDRYGNGADYSVVDSPGWNDFSMTVQAYLCPESGCPTPAPAPAPPPQYVEGDFKPWSDASTWPGGSAPAHAGDVTVTELVCFDAAASMPEDGSFHLNWLTIVPGAVLDIGGGCDAGRRLQGSGPRNYRLNIRSLIVWGTLVLGTPEHPVPIGDTVTIAFYGGLFSHTVVVTEGLFVRNKVLVVMGHLEVHGSAIDATNDPDDGRRLSLGDVSPSAMTWKRLHTTANAGSRDLVIKGDARAWPVGKKVGVSPTEYPSPPYETESEVRIIGNISYDASTLLSTITLTEPLTYTHFAGVVQSRQVTDGHWDRVELTAYVTLLDGRSNVIFTTGESDQELIDMSTDHSMGYPESEGHGGTVVIAGSQDGSFFGSANLSHVDFVRMGKRNLQHAALWFYYPGGFNKGDPAKLSRIENCVFSQNFAGGLQLMGVGKAPLSIVGNIFHSTARYGIQAVGPFRIGGGVTRQSESGDTPICKDDAIEIRNNFVLDNIRSPFHNEGTSLKPQYRPFASFMLEVRPVNFLGNIAAGSTDMGFSLRAPLVPCASAWESPVDEPLNEAVGCVIGFFFLRSRGAWSGMCGSIHGIVAWKNAHFGITTIDQAISMRVGQVVVSDNHIGLMLNFAQLAYGGDKSMVHRIYGHNITIFGSTAASTCGKSMECKAMIEGDEGGTRCNAAIGSDYRRTGLVTHMVTRLGKTCELGGKSDICDVPHQWFKTCVGPWEHRRGSLGARYSEAHWDKVTIGYFSKSDCGKKSYAISHNPTSIDFNFPNYFSDVKYLSTVDAESRFFLESHSGYRGDDGLWQLALIDSDGTLINGGVPNGTVLAAGNSGLATDSCTQVGSSIQCSKGDPHLKLNQLTWEPTGDFLSHRVFGRMKALRISDDRAIISEGPHKNFCPTDPAAIGRNWMVAPNEVYNLTLFARTPKNHLFYYFNDRPECIQINMFLSSPFRMDVWVNGAKLDENQYDSARANNPPRKPTLSDPHGTYTFDPHERTMFLIYCGGQLYDGVPSSQGAGYIFLELIQVVQLSMTISVNAEEFDQDKQRTFVDNVALLLRIPSWRIKIVGVQNIGARRLSVSTALRRGTVATQTSSSQARDLQQAGTSVVLQILPPNDTVVDDTSDDNETNTTLVATVSETGFDTASIEQLQSIASKVVELVESGEFDNMCANSGFQCSAPEVEVTDPETPLATEEPTTAPTAEPTAPGGVTETTQPLEPNTTTIPVASTVGFSVGDQIVVGDLLGAHERTFIVGISSLEVDPPIEGSWPAGTPISVYVSPSPTAPPTLAPVASPTEATMTPTQTPTAALNAVVQQPSEAEEDNSEKVVIGVLVGCAAGIVGMVGAVTIAKKWNRKAEGTGDMRTPVVAAQISSDSDNAA